MFKMALPLLLLLSPIFNGCSNREPLFIKRPLTESLPVVKPIDKRVISLKDSEIFSLSQPNRGRIPVDYISRGDFFNYKTSSPTIVISLPTDYVERMHDGNRTLSDKRFKTDGYYHSIEQLFEKALIRRGFAVVDRSKLEAQLRVGGKERHLSNISELLQMAQSSLDVDYILQINRADIEKVSSLNFDLMRDAFNREIIEDFKESRAGMQLEHRKQLVEYNRGYRGDKLPVNISIEGTKFTLNAKIINVYSGNIDWLGSLVSDSRDIVRDFKFNVGQVNSSDEILNREIEEYNSRVELSFNKLKETYSELQELYKEGEEQVTPFSLRYYNDSLKEQIREKRGEFQKGLSEFKTVESRLPQRLDIAPVYSYQIDIVDISPISIGDSEERRIIEVGINRLISTVGIGEKLSSY